jgi:hypothetical protein
LLRRTGTLAALLAGAALILPGSALGASLGPIETAAATTNSSSAANVDSPGLLVLNKSQTTSLGSHVTVLQVAGLDVLSKSGAVNTGVLALAGGLVDAVNAALCPDTNAPSGFCVALLFSRNVNAVVPPLTSQNASAATATVILGTLHLRVLGSEASTSNTHTFPLCGSIGHSYILNTDAVTASFIPPGLLENNATAGPGAC